MLGRKMISLPSIQALLLGLGLLFADCFAVPIYEVEALTAFKRAIFEDPLLVLLNWSPLVLDPCNWDGVYCSIAGDHVVKINISEASVKGFLAPEFYKLSALQELILHGNLLIGIIPQEIGLLTNLKVLDLGSNQLTGSIPHEIGNLTSIQKINLQSNVLTGKLPYELGMLRYLEELRLDRNKFIGTIPAANSSQFSAIKHGMYASNASKLGFCGASQLKVIDLAHNFLVGNVPNCLDYLPRSSFLGNCLQDKDTKQRPATQCGAHAASPNKTHAGMNTKYNATEVRSSRHQSKNSKPVWILVLEIMTGLLIGLLFVVAIFTVVQMWKRRRPSIIIPWKKSSTKDCMTMYTDSEAAREVVRYSREELELACEDFSNIIGSSPDSVVYKGTMKGGLEIAVISFCIKEDQWTGYLELYFQNEVADLARLNHQNTGKLLGYCRVSSPFTRMLVFEYASNGTLHEHLYYGEGSQFSWTRRMKIIIGIAQGLKYLHTQLDPPFTILELNSSSVYLTDDFTPKLVDFECWKTIISRSEKSSGTISNEGAVGIHPSSLEGRHVDVQGNIYAFGVLLLEIVSGRPPYCNEKGCLFDWAIEFLEFPDMMAYVVDRELKHFRYEDLKVIYEAVSLCIHPKSNRRKTVSELCLMLENGIDTSISAEIKSSVAWAELTLAS
ncbi:probable LRR receptor-like serine/threonine-protein kinase At1g63430 [Salvia hispanica]|uniref:probable LRR receptor-like serine/threonine-protein kinase At1g63430 n=1 Tax=Salvia hispanica TaxID=49212 RepID=UPI002009BF68|nr:probable LRR receptor-like serine/threonine-protein kinase At1g63430 [Salvia hispanica]